RPMNRSPAATRRESMLTPDGPCSPAAAAGARTSAAPAAHATRCASQSLMRRGSRPRSRRAVLCRRRPAGAQRFARDRDVVEWHLASVGELLPLLVSLTCDHQHVALLGARDGLCDRTRTVGDRADRYGV